MGEGGWLGLGKDEIKWCGKLFSENLYSLNSNSSTSGGVVFRTTAGELQSDPDNFFFDATNNWVGILNSSPRDELHVGDFTASQHTPSTGNKVIRIEANAGNGIYPELILNGRRDNSSHNIIGQILFANKTTSAAAISAHGDRTLELSTSGATAIFIESNRDIGMGTSSPGATLDISRATGSATITPVAIKLRSTTSAADWSTTANWGELQFHSNDASGPGNSIRASIGSVMNNTAGSVTNMVFNTSDATAIAERMRITGAGNVGIGTDVPSELLEISGGNIVVSNAAPVIEMKESDQTLPAGLFRFIGATDRFLLQRNTDVNGAFATSDDLIEAQADGDLIFLGEATGNVGISVASPAKTLQVNGTLSVSGGASAQYFVNASGGITSLITPVDLTTKSLLFSGGILVGYG